MVKDFFKRHNKLAVVSGPVYGCSTHYERWSSEGKTFERGVRVTLYKVTIQGQAAYHAPAKDLCREWLVRQGYLPA